jgi:SAM-dependent methyltransferase
MPLGYGLKRRYWGVLARARRSRTWLRDRLRTPALKNRGHCPTCDRDVTFIARDTWLRNHYLCSHCRSLPRERALMLVIDTHFPRWRQLAIHESSPGDRGASPRLARECPGYVPSQFFADRQPGTMVGAVRCENLEALTFSDESIDLHVTQDVLEHVFHPARVFAEIARTLRPGGAHVFTVPLVNRDRPSAPRARVGSDGQVEHLQPPSYHGNPISADGSLVTVDWGFDICQHIFDASGLFTHVVRLDDLSKGIRAELNEVLVTVKPAAGEPGRASA